MYIIKVWSKSNISSKMGRNVTCPPLGHYIKGRKDGPKHKWLQGSEDHGDLPEQASEFKALHEYECASDGS